MTGVETLIFFNRKLRVKTNYDDDDAIDGGDGDNNVSKTLNVDQSISCGSPLEAHGPSATVVILMITMMVMTMRTGKPLVWITNEIVKAYVIDLISSRYLCNHKMMLMMTIMMKTTGKHFRCIS